MKVKSLKDVGQKKPKDNQIQRNFNFLVIGMSLQLLISILIPLFVGLTLDNHLKTRPLYAMIGLLIGISLSILVIWNAYKNITKNTLVDNNLKKEDK